MCCPFFGLPRCRNSDQNPSASCTRASGFYWKAQGCCDPASSGHLIYTVAAIWSIDFSHFDGTELDGGEIRFIYAHRDLVAGLPLTPERSDVMLATVRLTISSRTSLTTFTYGLTDRLDIGATIPFNRTTLEAKVDEETLRLGTSDPTVHSFNGLGSAQQTSTGGGTVSGLGYVRAVAKYKSRIAIKSKGRDSVGRTTARL